MQHVYRTEKAAFSPKIGQLKPCFYSLTDSGYPDIKNIKQVLKKCNPKLICIENTHNTAGGTYIPLEVLKGLKGIAGNVGIPVHMDGARLFNASLASGIAVNEICKYADTVMFCI